VTEKCWKRAERRVAEILGGRRVPVSGRQRGATPDVAHEVLSVEVKTRKTLPAWIQDAMKQAEACAKEGQVPVTVLHQHGQRYRDSLVLMRLGDLEEREVDEEMETYLDPRPEERAAYDRYVEAAENWNEWERALIFHGLSRFKRPEEWGLQNRA
jgi:hypothetical protein